jgi:MoxR-like ATPase
MATLFLIQNETPRLVADFDALGKTSLVLGRRADCEITLSDGAVSGHHLRFDFDGAAWTVTDLDSSNGTEVDGNPIGTARLSEGSRIVLGGETELVFSLASPGEAEAAAPSAAPEASEDDLALVRAMRANTDRIRREIAKVIVGQHDVVEQVLTVLVAGGHGLLVGMPGMAKTLLVSTIAKVLDLDFKRVQFTPDLMPTDITGTEVLESVEGSSEKRFRFIPGPIFCNLLLADEINRTPPKTQAALLEAMQEKRVTAGNRTYELEPPFFVLATQNPIEQEGTYPLPEAQQDRFMFNIWVDYPQEEEEERIVKRTTVDSSQKPEVVLDREQVMQLQRVARKIPVSDHVVKYAIRLVRGTRPGDPKAPDFTKQYVATGAGPRAGQFLVLAAKARALLEGRVQVSGADVRAAAVPVLRHRILVNFAADSEGVTSTDIVGKLLAAIGEPSEADY